MWRAAVSTLWVHSVILVAGRAGEADAFVGQPRAEAKPARLRIDQQQAQARDASYPSPASREPTFSPSSSAIQQRSRLRIVVVDEVGDDLRAQAFERFGPAVFLRVELGVAGDDPAEIAGPRLAQNVAAALRRLRRSAAEQRLDRVHRGDQLRLLGGLEPAEHRADLRAASAVRAARRSCGRARSATDGSAGRRSAKSCADQAALLEIAQHAAEIAGVEIERAADVARGGASPLRDLVEHARLGQRVGAVELGLAQHADLPRVEAVEAAHRGDALLASRLGMASARFGQIT